MLISWIIKHHYITVGAGALACACAFGCIIGVCHREEMTQNLLICTHDEPFQFPAEYQYCTSEQAANKNTWLNHALPWFMTFWIIKRESACSTLVPVNFVHMPSQLMILLNPLWSNNLINDREDNIIKLFYNGEVMCGTQIWRLKHFWK